MAITANNTTLTFNDATTQTTSAVTAVNVSTGISSSGGKTPTLTNTGVTSLTAGTGITVSASTGGVTITNSSPGAVSSVNGQTGAIVSTTIDSIGSYISANTSQTAPNPNAGTPFAQYNITRNTINTTIAGSSLRYGLLLSWPGTGLNQLAMIIGGLAFQTNNSGGQGRASLPYTGGGTALSGTWRAVSGNDVKSELNTESDYTIAQWTLGLWVRIS